MIPSPLIPMAAEHPHAWPGCSNLVPQGIVHLDNILEGQPPTSPNDEAPVS